MADSANRTFDFVDINPGMSGLAFAAEAEGGVCVGVHRVKSNALAAYEAFFGRGSAEPPSVHGELVLVSLPFSMFVNRDRVDPAVFDLISLAYRCSQGVSAVLFRVPWSSARRLEIDPDEYRSAIEEVFNASKWVITTAVSDDKNDLFIATIAKSKWNGNDALPATYPGGGKIARQSNPQEILIKQGYPVNFALHNAEVDRKLLDGIVIVDNARAAIAGMIGSVK
jgi:hypothetical protein